MDRKKVIKKLQDAEISLRGFANHFPPLRDDCHEQADACYDAIEMLQSKPQIVRCKDCRYWQDNNNGYIHPDCRWGHNETPDPDDYCSFGELMEGR